MSRNEEQATQKTNAIQSEHIENQGASPCIREEKTDIKNSLLKKRTLTDFEKLHGVESELSSPPKARKLSSPE